MNGETKTLPAPKKTNFPIQVEDESVLIAISIRKIFFNERSIPVSSDALTKLAHRLLNLKKKIVQVINELRKGLVFYC